MAKRKRPVEETDMQNDESQLDDKQHAPLPHNEQTQAGEGLCILINRNDYPVSITFVDGDSVVLSPKQRATFSRTNVTTGSLPTGVSCL